MVAIARAVPLTLALSGRRGLEPFRGSRRREARRT